MKTRNLYLKKYTSDIPQNIDLAIDSIPNIRVYIKPKKTKKSEKIQPNQLTLQAIKPKPFNKQLFQSVGPRIRPIGCWNSITEQSESFYNLDSTKSKFRQNDSSLSPFFSPRKTSRFQMRNHEILEFLKGTLKKKFTMN